jgi:dTDP-4-dehydrorhamnose reductase
MQSGKIVVFGSSGQVGWELRHKLACLDQVKPQPLTCHVSA